MNSLKYFAFLLAVSLISACGMPSALYVDRDYNDIRHALPMLAGKDRDNASLIANFPIAAWLTGGTPMQVQRDVARIVAAAAERKEMPVLVAYNLPFRDCQQYSAGGSASTKSYQAWIDGFAEGVAKHSAIVILEPDALGIIPNYTNLSGEKEWCQPKGLDSNAVDSRFAELNYAVDRLARLPNVRVYLDGTHSRWLPVEDVAQRLLRAGITRTAGFFLNVSNYHPTDEQVRYGVDVSKHVAHIAGIEDERRFPHFVIDTSRNGRGAWAAPTNKYADPQAWCNPPGRGLGERPTLVTSHALLDAKLWIKVPGESDGQCTRGTAGPRDPERGMVDPPAGKWFKEQAAELIELAVPPISLR